MKSLASSCARLPRCATPKRNPQAEPSYQEIFYTEHTMERAQILESISQLTVLDLSHLIKDLEEKSGVSAAAALAVSAPAARAAGGAAAVDEKTEFTVDLAAIGDKKVNV